MAGILAGNATGVGVATISWAPAAVAADTTAEQFVTIPGVLVGDFLAVSGPGLTPGVGAFRAHVTAANTVAVTFFNCTGGALTPPAGAWAFFYLRPEGGTRAAVVA